ncbi:fimbrial protein [Entomohabitans teleogrylli]|uniref:fimbrial protein n=1 Tax=Entomohabitans teleogrylli TaxID=1384589 RepID=UPI0012B69E0F|nr:type 1 fimbrial protein [Entomohabitans teleogrylli]
MTISVMRDLPVGGVLFRQIIKDPDTMGLGFRNCTNTSGGLEYATTSTVQWAAEGGMPAVVSSWSGHNVYDTGVTGIGMVLMHGGYGPVYGGSNSQIFPGILGAVTIVTGGNMSGTASNTMGTTALELLLVKTGDIPAGTWTVPILLPPLVIDAELTGDVDTANSVTRDYGSRITVSGAVNVVSGTCQTPDVNVAMGQHKVSGSSVNTDWVDFTISLLNCPPMHGRYVRTSLLAEEATNQWLDTGNSVSGSPDQSNPIGLSLNPVNDYETLLSGGQCAQLTPGANTASGTCVEIQNAQGNNVLTDSSMAIVTESGLTPQASAASYQIPLKARYGVISGSSGMSAGKADTAVEFTINYQ